MINLSLLIYSLFLVSVVMIAFIYEYSSRKLGLHKKLVGHGKIVVDLQPKTPYLNLFIITVILSSYSAYLAMSGKLTDTTRYAWSFLYRYPAYYDSIDTLLNSKTEIGYLLINMFISTFTNDPFWLFLFVAFITTFINLYSAFKISKSYALMIFLYLISMYFFQSTYLLRQTLAVSFINLALIAYLKGARTKYILFSIVALTFHVTAIIMFPLYFIFNKIKSRKMYFYIILISFTVFILFGHIFNTLLPKIPYLDQFMDIDNLELSTGGGTFTSIFKGLPFYFITILALIKRGSIIRKNDKADFYLTCSIFYSISWLLSYNMYWFFRMGWYFFLPTLALVPIVFGTIKNTKERLLYYLILVFALIIITYRQIFITIN